MFLESSRGSRFSYKDDLWQVSFQRKIGLGAATQSQGQPIIAAVCREATEMPGRKQATINPIRADGKVWLRAKWEGGYVCIIEQSSVSSLEVRNSTSA